MHQRVGRLHHRLGDPPDGGKLAVGAGGNDRESPRQLLLHLMVHLFQERVLRPFDGKVDEHQDHRERQGQGGGVEFQAQAVEDFEHRLVRRLQVDGVQRHRDADHRSQEAEDRDRPDDHAEQTVAVVQAAGVEVGKGLQFVVEPSAEPYRRTCSRAARNRAM